MRRVLCVAFLVAVIGPAFAGPPAICWPIEIGDAKSLPWGKDSFERASGYDQKRVVEDTLALLDGSMPVLVRMETLRRATIYLEESGAGRDQLLRALMARVLDAEAAQKPSALAWFDAGYAQGCASQMRERGPTGYAWVKRALEIGGDNPEIHYGCCLLTLMDHRDQFKGHLEKADAGAAKNPLLAKNLELLGKLYPPVLKYLEEKGKGAGKGERE